MAFEDVQMRTREIFLRSTSNALESFHTSMLTAFALEEPALEPPVFSFSTFLPDHVERAMAVVETFMKAAEQKKGEAGLDAVLDEFESLKPKENPDLLYYALMVFITHHPKGRLLADDIPPLTAREPEKVAPSTEIAGVAGAEESIVKIQGGVLPKSDGLEWYREDPFANEHHEHWHIVYPTSGIPDGKGGRKTKDRQGELFFYMHQQMLARYDAERRALGKPRVFPFGDYRELLLEGYDPGPRLSGRYDKREAKLAFQNLYAPPSFSPYNVLDHELRRDRIYRAVETGVFENTAPPQPVSLDRLGATVESTSGTASESRAFSSFYGNFHGMGHIMAALINTPFKSPFDSATDNVFPGVMGDTATAIRDPFFYRWHKHIDDIYFTWQQKQSPNNFSDRPYVAMRKSFDGSQAKSQDIILSLRKELPVEDDSKLLDFGRETFGGEHWDDVISDGKYSTTELRTWMVTRNDLEIATDGKVDKFEQLVHDEFVYFLRVENLLNRHYTVTVRIFLVPISGTSSDPNEPSPNLQEDRRAWIEMDKFLYELQPLERAVITRRGSDSSVVRKPSRMTPDLLTALGYVLTAESLRGISRENPALPQELLDNLATLKDKKFDQLEEFVKAIGAAVGAGNLNGALRALILKHSVASEKPASPFLPDGSINPKWRDTYNYCTCGWPYNLLLPRGTREGMSFRLAVVLTDWEVDRVGPESCCGSVSFCGALDQYPDKRPMGYPFDRRFEFPISDTIMSNANMAFQDIKIRWLENAPKS